MIFDDANEVLMSPVIFTQISDLEEYQQMPLFKLQDLFLDFETIPDDLKKKNAFKVRFTTYRYDPSEDIREVVQTMCPQCKVTGSCKDLDAEAKAKCTDCNVDCELIYQV